MKGESKSGELTRGMTHNRLMTIARDLSNRLRDVKPFELGAFQRLAWTRPKDAARELVGTYSHAASAYTIAAERMARLSEEPAEPAFALTMIAQQVIVAPAFGNAVRVLSCAIGVTIVWEVSIYHARQSGTLPPDFVWSVHVSGQPVEVLNGWEVALERARERGIAHFGAMVRGE